MRLSRQMRLPRQMRLYRLMSLSRQMSTVSRQLRLSWHYRKDNQFDLSRQLVCSRWQSRQWWQFMLSWQSERHRQFMQASLRSKLSEQFMLDYARSNSFAGSPCKNVSMYEYCTVHTVHCACTKSCHIFSEASYLKRLAYLWPYDIPPSPQWSTLLNTSTIFPLFISLPLMHISKSVYSTCWTSWTISSLESIIFLTW